VLKVIVGIAVGIISLLIGAFLIFFILFIKRKKAHIISTHTTNMRFNHSSNSKSDIIAQNESYASIHTTLTHSQITYNELSIEREIGEGSYGRVYVGNWNGTRVAIKFCRNKTKLDEFMHEVRLIMYVCEYEYM
jgi:hypothetical protein